MNQPRLLQQLLADHGSGLERLMERARAIAELDRRLKRHLPPSIADHISVANLRDDILFLQATAAEWRSRAHFLLPQLVQKLGTDPQVPKVAEIRIHIAPAARQEQRPEGAARLSAAAARSLRAASQSIGDDALRLALARLAARSRPTGKDP